MASKVTGNNDSDNTLESMKKGDANTNLEKHHPGEELDGLMSKNIDDFDKLSRSVLENDKETIDDGMMVNEGIDQGVGVFTPDLAMEKFVRDYKQAEKIYGEKLIRQLTGYDPNYVEKNINIPEFQRHLREKIQKNIEALQEKGLLDRRGVLTEKAFELASLTLYVEELDELQAKGLLGEKEHKRKSLYGEKGEIHDYHNHERYKDIAIKKSIKTSIKRGHKKLLKQDLKVFERESKGRINIIYAIDASGSMKGQKIKMAKKAGIALAYTALEKKDKVGLIIFGSEVETAVHPSDNFMHLVRKITKIRASRETDIAATIEKSVELFTERDCTNHLILLTDGLHTKGDPFKEVLPKVSMARDVGITVSVIGVNLEDDGEQLAKNIVDISEGRLYVVKDIEDIDGVVLQDYYSAIA